MPVRWTAAVMPSVIRDHNESVVLGEATMRVGRLDLEAMR